MLLCQITAGVAAAAVGVQDAFLFSADAVLGYLSCCWGVGARAGGAPGGSVCVCAPGQALPWGRPLTSRAGLGEAPLARQLFDSFLPCKLLTPLFFFFPPFKILAVMPIKFLP